QVNELGIRHGACRAEHETESAGTETVSDEILEPGLYDGDLGAAQALDLLGHDVGADDVVAEMGEAGSGGQADVARADDGDATHVKEFYPRRNRRSLGSSAHSFGRVARRAAAAR